MAAAIARPKRVLVSCIIIDSLTDGKSNEIDLKKGNLGNKLREKDKMMFDKGIGGRDLRFLYIFEMVRLETGSKCKWGYNVPRIVGRHPGQRASSTAAPRNKNKE